MLLCSHLKLNIGQGMPEECHELQEGCALLTLGPSCTSSPYVKNGGANTSRTEQRKFSPL
jgi:hypothetical protein